ncbi:MAG: nucleotidyltransferase domain-containing protein [Chloroflexi bacterium]|nr:nucleotidyltransferase domain-containing protein [Chloroflexota bacterium]
MLIAQSTQADQSILPEVITALRAALTDRLVAVVLFGSRARNDASAESDWDMLVIAESLPAKAFERHLYLKRILPPDCRGAVSMLARTPVEFEAAVPSLYLDIALDGQILYDPRGYAAERLAALRRLIEHAGLYRERTADGDLWRWQVEPAQPWSLSWP